MRAAKAHGRDGERRHELSSAEREDLLRTLKARFEKHSNRHKGAEWANVQARLEANPAKLWSLYEMEKTGGEPDVVDDDGKSGECLFFDCSAESPKGRRSCCYDREALDARKEHKPKTSAVEMARVAEGLAADLLHAGSGGQRSPRIPPPPQYFTSWSCIASPSGSVKYSSGVPPSAPPRSGMRREM